MTPYQRILEDLRKAHQSEYAIPYPKPYEDNMNFEEKFRLTNEAVERSKRIGDRILWLVNLFYLGQLLERQSKDNKQRSYYRQQLTEHFRIIVTRMFFLFEYLGVEQIMRTTQITPTMLREISQTEYQRLVTKALEIFNGVENWEGSDVTQ
ncbi:unnamed protein product [Rhizophagus irregularis]|nr:unnamed protein product [Rhizophagus irregularis]